MSLHDSNRSRLRNETKKKKRKKEKRRKKNPNRLLLLTRNNSRRAAHSMGKLDREGRYNGKTKRDGGISNEEYRIGSNRGRVAAYVARTKSQWTIVDGGETILPTVGIYVVRHASNRYTINGISCVGNAPNGSSLFNALSDVYIYIYISESEYTPLSLRGRKRAERNFSLSRKPSGVESCKSARRRFH